MHATSAGSNSRCSPFMRMTWRRSRAWANGAASGPERYREFLEWLSEKSDWIDACAAYRIRESGATSRRNGTIELGTFQELATDFDAGEGYERWYLAPDWAPYRGYFSWTESRIKGACGRWADRTLIELAEKQLLVANWETAWHTPPAGPHGDASQNGHASPGLAR